MNLTLLPITAALIAVCAGTASAQGFTPLLTATAGTGSEETFLTVDFKDGSQNDSFAFGYKYDGVKTGTDLLNAFAPDGLMTQYIYNGRAVNGFTFGTHTEAGFAATGYWAYYKGPDGQNWTYSSVGVTAPLTNGAWDGWSWAPQGNAVPPITPAAVPEASSAVSLGILALLGAGFIAIRRKKTA